jgi:hypothetical protein
MKKNLVAFIFFVFHFTSSQTILAEYPEGQYPYKNGIDDVFAGIQNYFETNNIVNVCSPKESIWITLMINEKGQPFLIRKKNMENDIKSNSCAFDMASNALVHLKNWKPAQKNNKNVTAYFDFLFIPFHFFDNYKTDYNISDYYTKAKFPGGYNVFKNEVHKNLIGYLDYNSYVPYGNFTISFDINEQGKISNVEIEPKLKGTELFFEDIKYAVTKVKTKWEPATLNSMPIKQKFRMNWFFIDN